MGWLLRRLSIGIAVGSLLVGELQGKAGPQTYTLDFVGGSTAAAQRGSKAEIRPPRVAPGSGLNEPMPFELTLLSLDRNGYTIGDDVVFEVLLKHVGLTPVAFPWSRDMAAVSDAPRAQISHVLLTFTDPILGRQLVGFDNTLYGADTCLEPCSCFVREIRSALGPRLGGGSQWGTRNGLSPHGCAPSP